MLASLLPTKSSECLEQGQIGLTRAVVLDAATLPNPNVDGARRAGEEGFDNRGLPNPGLPGDEYNLPLSAHRPVEARAQFAQLALATDHERAVAGERCVPATVNRRQCLRAMTGKRGRRSDIRDDVGSR